MINRIRVVTLLVMVLGVFALLQLISGSLFFSSLHHSQKSFVVSNQLREQQGELTSTWDLMLQTRINLSRSAVRMMMDSSNQQSNAKVELLDSARKTLAQAATHYKKFKSMAPLPEMDRVTQQNASLVQESAAAAAALEEQASRLTQAVSAFRLAASPLTNKPQTPSRPASEQPPAQPRLRIAEQDPNWETF
ncbi:Tar ligand binding domain-containing protein [Escherichia coli]|nr:Tar ligand binding domain-containing protein [Escherichia coli]